MKVEFDPRSSQVPELLAKREEHQDFTKVLKEAIQKVNELQLEADRAVEELSLGKGELHETVLAIEKADISFRLMMQIRNKLIKAYEEVMKMPL